MKKKLKLYEHELVGKKISLATLERKLTAAHLPAGLGAVSPVPPPAVAPSLLAASLVANLLSLLLLGRTELHGVSTDKRKHLQNTPSHKPFLISDTFTPPSNSVSPAENIKAK